MRGGARCSSRSSTRPGRPTVRGAALGAVPVREHDGRLAMAGRAPVHRLGVPPVGMGQVTSGKWLFGDGAPIQGLVSGAMIGRRNARLVPVVPGERRRAQRRAVRDAGGARRAGRRPRPAGGPAHGHRRVRRRVHERELHPRRVARRQPRARDPRACSSSSRGGTRAGSGSTAGSSRGRTARCSRSRPPARPRRRRPPPQPSRPAAPGPRPGGEADRAGTFGALGPGARTHMRNGR